LGGLAGMTYRIDEILWRLGPMGIVGLTALGVITGVQLTDAAGCEISPMSMVPWLWQPVWTSTPQTAASVNSVVSGLLISLAALAAASPRKIAEKALVGEFLCFLLYLFVLKGGYAIGFAGQADSMVLWYDGLALEIRLLVIAVLFSHRLGICPRLLHHAAVFVATGLGAITLLTIKRAMFPFPLG
jgi:hypothetical protein